MSNLVKKLVANCFRQDDVVEVQELLASECSKLPLTDGAPDLVEKIQISIIKLSQGNVTALKNWINEAKNDWRDVLDAAGFYNDSMNYLAWRPNSDDQ